MYCFKKNGKRLLNKKTNKPLIVKLDTEDNEINLGFKFSQFISGKDAVFFSETYEFEPVLFYPRLEGKYILKHENIIFRFNDDRFIRGIYTYFLIFNIPKPILEVRDQNEKLVLQPNFPLRLEEYQKILDELDGGQIINNCKYNTINYCLLDSYWEHRCFKDFKKRVPKGVVPKEWYTDLFEKMGPYGAISVDEFEKRSLIKYFGIDNPIEFLEQGLYEFIDMNNYSQDQIDHQFSQGDILLPYKDIKDKEIGSILYQDGNLLFIKWMVSKGALLPVNGANIAAYNNHIELLQWTLEEKKVYPAEWSFYLIKELRILEYLYDKGIKPNQDATNRAARDGDINRIIWIYEKTGIHPDQKCVDRMHPFELDTLKFIANKFNVYPSQESVNVASEYGNLDILKWMAIEKNIYPDQEGANRAARSGSLEVLKWLAQEKNIYPDLRGIAFAIQFGKIEVLKWYLGLGKKITHVIQILNAIKEAVGNGHLEVLILLSEIEDLIKPLSTINLAMSRGQVEVLKWIFEKYKNIIPKDLKRNFNIENVIYNGHLEVLVFLSKLNPPIYPSEIEMEQACRGGHLEVLKWGSKLNPPIYPKSIEFAIYGNKFHVVKWAYNLYPKVDYRLDIMNNTVKYDRVYILKWLAQQNYYPGKEQMQIAIKNHSLESVKWIVEQGFKPTRDEMNQAEYVNDFDIVKYFVDLGIKPNKDTVKNFASYNYVDVKTIDWLLKYKPSITDKKELLRLLSPLDQKKYKTEIEQYFRNN